MKRHILPALLVACTLIVALWLVMARQSSQPFRPFDLTAKDFIGFSPALPGWSVRSIPVSTSDPAEPNILALAVTSIAGLSGRQVVPGEGGDARSQPSTINHQPITILVRLVHGYNMPMCMKIKGYTVVALSDHCGVENKLSGSQVAGRKFGDTAGEQRLRVSASTDSSSSPRQPNNSTTQQPAPPSLQLWRVTSSVGEVSIWVTTMIRAGDFSPTSVDVCSMAFPRVDVPDDPGWIPRGLTWASLRHPVSNLRQWGRARWNASRTDLLTFLRLRQPAWASDELLTYITCSMSPAVTADNEEESVKNTTAVHAQMLESLQKWRGAQVGLKQE